MVLLLLDHRGFKGELTPAIAPIFSTLLALFVEGCKCLLGKIKTIFLILNKIE
jgi:hypothetical protein